MVSDSVKGGRAGNEANLDALIQGGGDPLEHGQRMALVVRILQPALGTFRTDDFLVVDAVHRGEPIPTSFRQRVEHLIELGVLERVGRGRGSRLLLSRRFYRHLGKPGVYTRKHGLDRETNKALLLKHIEDNARTGATLEELRQVLPALSAASVQWLVRQLKSEGKIQVQGKTRSARWFPVGGQLAGDEGGRNG